MSQYSRNVVIKDAQLDEFAHVDFENLESLTGLEFNEELKKDIRYYLSRYEFDLEVFQNIPAEDVRDELGRVIDACDLLTSILPTHLENREESHLESVKQAVWTCSAPNSLWAGGDLEVDRFPDDFDVAGYLNRWKDNAEAAKLVKGKPGRHRNIARLLFLGSLHEVYLSAGGIGSGCCRSAYAADGYEGKFLDFTYTLLEYTSAGIKRATLADYIIKNYKKGK
ncbi:MAG: hypothetical protein JEY79_11890 [Pseudodesulfovibrio sp.]|nr:hypothetical protein [Pseudodesulfovibrio sp.]